VYLWLAYNTPATDPEVLQTFQNALGELRRRGATVRDPVAVENLDTMRREQTGCNQFKYDLNRYLAGLGDKAPSFPAITVPMGFTRGGTLPAGLQFLGRAWSEAALIKLAYPYEQATHHRRPPAITPPLR